MTVNIIQEFRRAPAAIGPHAHHGGTRNRAHHHRCRSLLPSHAIQRHTLHPGRHPHLLQIHEGLIDRNQISAFAVQHSEIIACETKESIGIDGAQLELTPGRTEGGSSIEYLVTSGTVTIAGQDLAQLSVKQLEEFRLNHIGFIFQQP